MCNVIGIFGQEDQKVVSEQLHAKKARTIWKMAIRTWLLLASYRAFQHIFIIILIFKYYLLKIGNSILLIRYTKTNTSTLKAIKARI